MDIFEVKFGKKKTKRATEASSERSAEQLFNDLESVAFLLEGSDLGTSEDRFEPTASCINDTKKRQLVTRSGLSRLRCCVCHLRHKWAMHSPTAVRELFGTVLQQVCHFKVDVIAGSANARCFVLFGSADGDASFFCLGWQWMGQTPLPRLHARPCLISPVPDEHD